MNTRDAYRWIVALALAVMILMAWQAASSFTVFGPRFPDRPITYSCGSQTAALAFQQWANESGLRDGGCSANPDIEFAVVSPWPYGSAAGVGGIRGVDRNGNISSAFAYVRPGYGEHLGVVTHEFGHALGIGHSEYHEAMMAPLCCNPLGPDDLAAIRFLYGPPEAGPTVVPPTVTPTAPTPPPTPTPSPTPKPWERRVIPGLARD